MPVDTHGEEEIPGISPAVELGSQIVERLHMVEYELALRTELRDHSKRRPGIISGFAHRAVAQHLVEVAVERQHLSIQTIERAETEGAVLLQLTNGNDPSIDTFDQCGRGRDLKQRRMVDLQS